MKKITNILYFHLFTFVQLSKYVIPLVLLLFFQIMIYTIARGEPSDLVNDIILAEIFAFVIAILVGFASSGWTDHITEQLLILRIKSDALYYSIHALFLFVISIFISLISILVPVIFHLLDPGFFQQFTISYLMKSFLLLLGSSFAGISLGALLHPRIIFDKEGALYAGLISLVAITRHAVANQFEIFRYVLWLLPNVSAHHAMIVDSSYFTFLLVGRLFLISILYGLAYSFIKVLLLSKRKF